MRNKVIDTIIRDAQQKILERTGEKYTLIPKRDYATEDVLTLCDKICTCWGVTHSWLRIRSRKEDRPTMKKVLWYIVKTRNPKISFHTLALLVGNEDHAGASNGLQIAKDLLSVRDEIFLKYYEPVKFLLRVEKQHA